MTRHLYVRRRARPTALRPSPIRLAVASTALLGAVVTVLGADATEVGAAATRVAVTTTLDVVDPDDGVTSLREAVAIGPTVELQAGATYVLGCGEPGEDDGNREGDLDIRTESPFEIDGNGATITTLCDDEALLDIGTSPSVEIDGVHLLGGHGLVAGGALRIVDSVEVDLVDVTVTGTTTSGGECGEKCAAVGAVYVENVKRLDLVRTTITGNTAAIEGCEGGCSAVGGLAVYSVGSVYTIDTVVRDNHATTGDACRSGCGAVAGVELRVGTAWIERTAVVANETDVPELGCEICWNTGGLQVDAPEGTTLVNATVADNTATGVRGAGGVMRVVGTITLTASTLADNVNETVLVKDTPEVEQVASNLETPASKEPVRSMGTVIGSATGESGCALSAETLVDAVDSFESGDACGFDPLTNLVGRGDPLLDALTPSVDVRAPLPGSPVIDTVAPEDCVTADDHFVTDRPIGDGCDMGAVEAQLGLSRFVALAPVRLFDSRATEAAPGPKGFVAAGGDVTVQVTGTGQVPGSGVTAVVLNVTATETAAPGFVTAWPAGLPRPLASNINITAAGQTRSNLVTVPVGDGGRIVLHASGGAHLLADVAGYYRTTTAPVAEGRLVPLVPNRLFDTRPDQPAAGPKGAVGAGVPITVQVTGRSMVPAHGAAAVVLNVTATGPTGPGFVSAWPTGGTRPLASIVNLTAAGDTSSNLVMVPIGDDGTIQLMSSVGAHLLADVTAYVTDGSGAPSLHGMFVPLSPTRVFDTRPAEVAAGPKGVVAAGGTVRTPVGGVAGVPADASAVVLNLAATGAGAPGFVTTWPAGNDRPLASTLNLAGGDTRANATIVRLGAGGVLDHYSLSAVHLLADTAGYFVA